MVKSSGKNIWVGITDRQTEGFFRYVNGQTVNIIKGQPFLYYFTSGEPNDNGGNEDCLHFWTESGELNDIGCGVTSLSTGIDFHGLCEMKNFVF